VTFDPYTFEEERKSFQRTGVALGPDERGSVVERGVYGHERKRFDKDTGTMVVIGVGNEIWNHLPDHGAPTHNNQSSSDSDGSSHKPTHPTKKRPRTQHTDNTHEPLVDGSDDDVT